MALQETEKVFNKFQLNLLNLSFILIATFDLLFLLSGFLYSNTFMIEILNTIANIYLFCVIVLLVRTYPGFRAGVRLVFISILEMLYILYSTFFYITVPSIDPSSNLNSIPLSTMSLFNNSIIPNLIIGLFGSVLYVIFAFYLTIWFNRIFGRKNDFIKLFLISAIVGLASFLFLATYEVQIKALFSEVLSSGQATTSMASDFNNLFSYIGIYATLHIGYLVLELMAFVKFFNRIRAIQNGTYSGRQFSQMENQNNFNNQLLNSNQYTVISNSNAKVCSNCGKELIEEAVFCPYCGTRFLKNDR